MRMTIVAAALISDLLPELIEKLRSFGVPNTRNPQAEDTKRAQIPLRRPAHPRRREEPGKCPHGLLSSRTARALVQSPGPPVSRYRHRLRVLGPWQAQGRHTPATPSAPFPIGRRRLRQDSASMACLTFVTITGGSRE